MGLQSHQRFSWGSIGFKLTKLLQLSVPCRLLNWGPQYLSSCWPKATLSSLVHGSLHIEPHTMAACFFKTTKVERVTYMQSYTSCHLYHILLVRSRSQVPPTLKERKPHKAMTTRIMRVPIESVCHITLFSQSSNEYISNRGARSYMKLLLYKAPRTWSNSFIEITKDACC